MPFEPKLEVERAVAAPVRAARVSLRGKGWSYRAAAPLMGVSYQHLAHVLTGRRESRKLLKLIHDLPAKEVAIGR